MNVMIQTVNSGEPVERAFMARSGEHKLKARLFCPVSRPRAVVIVNAATGVRQRFYRPFAEWLAATQGLAAVTYDYRDFGESAVTHPRAATATMADWAVKDPQAIRAEVQRQLPGTPVWHMGHSLGGLGIAFQQGVSQIDRVITVASGPVHFWDHPWHYKPVALAFWYALGPLATTLMGFMPGRGLRVGPDLPASVYWQWRRWCTAPGFFAGDFGKSLPYPDWTGVSCPVRMVVAKDDALVPPASVWRSFAFYPEASKSQKVLHPAAYGLSKLGHIGVFAPENAACWPDIIGLD